MVSVTTFTTSSLWRSVARRTPTDRTVGATPLAVAVIAAATQNRRPVVPDSVSVPTPDTAATYHQLRCNNNDNPALPYPPTATAPRVKAESHVVYPTGYDNLVHSDKE